MMLKKWNSLILAFVLLVGSAAAFPARGSADAGAEPDGLAYALHIMDKKDVDKTITRSDAAGIVLRLLGYTDAVMESGEIFDDVSENHENAKAVYTAHKLGIISGTEHSLFEPDTPVSYEQLAKMLVCALGYTQRAEQFGGYPYGYTAVAAELKLDRNITMEDYNKLNGDTVAQIAENALSAQKCPAGNVENSNNTLLYQVFRLVKYTGVVTGAYGASYTPYSYAQSPDDVYINDTRYKTGESGIAAMAGCRVEFYVEDGTAGEETVVYAEKLPCREIEIAPELVSQTAVDRNGISVSFFTSENARRATTERLMFDSTNLVYNGMYTDITKSEADLFDFSDGSIRLLDYNQDNTWDFVVVEHSITAVVDSYASATGTISFEYPVELGAVSAQTLNLSEYDDVIYEGGLAAEDGFQEGDVLKILLPRNDGVFPKTAIRIAASDRIVRAELSEKAMEDNKGCMVMNDGQTYTFSDEYAAYAPDAFDGLQVGAEYTLYLTDSGKIAYLLNHLEEERVYGYLTDMAIGQFDTVTMKVFMDDGTFHFLEFAETVRVYRDGVYAGIQTPRQATEGLFVNGTFDKGQAQLIRFRPNRDSKVTVIEFAQNALGAEAAAEGYLEGSFVKSRDKFTGTYFHFSQIVYTESTPEFPFPSTVPCFTVPEDPADFDDPANFSVGGFSGQRGLVTVDTYNDDAMGVPGVIVRYGGADTHQEFSISTAMAVVKDITTCIGPDGEECEKMTDAAGNSYLAKKEDNVFADQVTGEPLKRGDTVQVGTSKGGYVQFVDMLFFTDENAPNGYGYTYTDPATHTRNEADKVIACGTLDSDRIIASGYLAARTSQYIKIRNAAGEEAIFKCNGTAYPLVTVYQNRGIVETGQMDQAAIGDFLVLRCGLSNLTEAVRYID